MFPMVLDFLVAEWEWSLLFLFLWMIVTDVVTKIGELVVEGDNLEVLEVLFWLAAL